jgi:hypothetical protein
MKNMKWVVNVIIMFLFVGTMRAQYHVSLGGSFSTALSSDYIAGPDGFYSVYPNTSLTEIVQDDPEDGYYFNIYGFTEDEYGAWSTGNGSFTISPPGTTGVPAYPVWMVYVMPCIIFNVLLYFLPRQYLNVSKKVLQQNS